MDIFAKDNSEISQELHQDLKNTLQKVNAMIAYADNKCFAGLYNIILNAGSLKTISNAKSLHKTPRFLNWVSLRKGKNNITRYNLFTNYYKNLFSHEKTI